MGVAGVSMLAMIYFIYRSIRAICEYIAWSKRPIVVGTFTKLLMAEPIYKDDSMKKLICTKYRYIYEFEYKGEKLCMEFLEKTDKNKPSKITIGEKRESYYNEKDKSFAIVKEVKNALWQFPLFAIGSGVVLLICVLIATAL